MLGSCAYFTGWLGMAAALAAQAANPVSPDRRDDAAESGGWIHSATVRAGAGWRDNPLLSPFDPVGSGFAQAEIETLSVWSRDHWQFVSMVVGDVVRYVDPPPGTRGEDVWFAHAELGWERPSWLGLKLKVDGFLQNSVIDLSETAAMRTVLPARVRGGYATFVAPMKLPGGFVIEPLLQARRTDYRNFSGDNDEGRGGARLEWQPGERLQIGFAWREHRRGYVDRNEYTAGGRPRAGTRLRFWQQAAELTAATTWELAGHWSAEVMAGRLENRDRSSGYFDYDQDRLGLELDWRRGAWSAAAAADAGWMTYRIQTSGTGIAPPARAADSLDLDVRVQRELRAGWAVFSRWQRERAWSNEPGFSYRASIVSAGVQRDF